MTPLAGCEEPKKLPKEGGVEETDCGVKLFLLLLVLPKSANAGSESMWDDENMEEFMLSPGRTTLLAGVAVIEGRLSPEVKKSPNAGCESGMPEREGLCCCAKGEPERPDVGGSEN
jgi:hypothetical protein